MRRTTLFTALALLVLVLPHAVHAAIPFLGHIIPDAQNRCPGGWGLLVVVINNIIQFLITVVVVFIAPLMIAYAGFLLVVNPFNPGAQSRAKGLLLNTVVGIIIALAAWVIVDAVMAVIYNPNASNGTTTLTQWQNLMSNNGQTCISQKGINDENLTQAAQGVASVTTATAISGTLAQCPATNSYCSPTALQAAGFSSTQANVMSCIAVTESSGDPSLPPYNITHPDARPISTACGLFQITQATWNKYAPAGSCSSFSSCQTATCNTQVAQVLVSKNGYSDWTCANCNAKAAACIQKYGGG